MHFGRTLLEDDNFDMIFVLKEMLEKLSCSLCTGRITVFTKKNGCFIFSKIPRDWTFWDSKLFLNNLRGVRCDENLNCFGWGSVERLNGK